MTASEQTESAAGPEDRVSTSPLPLFEPGDLAQELRVRQSDFARLCGVSRQTVSVWVRKGKIKSVLPDGTFNPRQAAREVITSTEPARLRAKIFRIASEDAAALRRRVADLGREVASRDVRYQELAAVFETFRRLLVERKSWICADAGARFETEVAETVAMAWCEVLNPEGPDERLEEEEAGLPLFAKGENTFDTDVAETMSWHENMQAGTS